MFSSRLDAGREPDRFATADGLWTNALARGSRTPAFRLVRGGATLPSGAYCRAAGIGHRTIDDVIQPNRVLELYAEGATMVLQGLQLTDPVLARAANNLALALDHPVQINAYLSPAAARGLELHFDFHDVFVLQLEGRKRWRVWAPLPRTRDPVRTGRKIPLPTLDELGEPMLDLTLTRGDCLYLPRGFPHAAETIDAASSHLTIGVLAITWQRAFRRALDAAVAAGDLTASIPARSPRRDASAAARSVPAREPSRSGEPAPVAGQGDLASPAGDPPATAGAARDQGRHASGAHTRPVAVADDDDPVDRMPRRVRAR